MQYEAALTAFAMDIIVILIIINQRSYVFEMINIIFKLRDRINL